MDLELSEDEAALRNNVRSVLGGICPASVPRAVFEGGDCPPELWQTMVDLGWPALAIAEAHGGLGLGFVELVIVAEELGRAVAPGPFLATTTQYASALAELGGAVSSELLGAVAAGARTGTLAVAEAGSWSLEGIATTALSSGSGWSLTGSKCAVVDGDRADEVLVVARAEGGLGAFVVPRSQVVTSRRVTVDPTVPLVDLQLEQVHVPDERVVAAPGPAGVEVALARALQRATVASAAMTVGACRRIFEVTVDYAKAREQYGRPIGSFQALKHRMVDMLISVERATALVYLAALTIAEDDEDRAIATAAAKAAAGDCQRLLVEEGLQLHGGIGFTWEHDLHLLLKRAKTGDSLFGGGVAQRAHLAQLIGAAPGGIS